MNGHNKFIVWDWNCTLLDDIGALHLCTNRLLESEGHAPVEIEQFRTHYNIPFRDFYRSMGFDEAQVDKLMSLENSAFHNHYEPLAAMSDLRAGAVEILGQAHAHGVESLILSNHIVEPIRNQLRRLAIEHLVADVLAYADRATQFVDMTKGERLRRYMVKKKREPAVAMIVGDTVEEIHIGRELGLISVAITGGCSSEQRLRAEGPDHVIHSLHELKPILQERGFVP